MKTPDNNPQNAAQKQNGLGGQIPPEALARLDRQFLEFIKGMEQKPAGFQALKEALWECEHRQERT